MRKLKLLLVSVADTAMVAAVGDNHMLYFCLALTFCTVSAIIWNFSLIRIKINSFTEEVAQ